MTDETDDKAVLKDVIEYLTTCGSTEFDASKLKTMKNLCKKSPENIGTSFNEIFSQLHKKHSEIRLSSICLMDELFSRSCDFRDMVVDQIENILNLTLTSEKPLPPPKSAAKLLRDKTRKILKDWHDKYTGHYVKLSLALKFITPTHTPSTSEPITEQQMQSNILEIEMINVRKNKEMQYNNLKNIIDQELPEILKALKEAESCFFLLVPRIEEGGEQFNLKIEKNPREIGKITNDYSLEIKLDREKFTKVVVRENEDNHFVILKLKEGMKIIERKYLKKVKSWIKKLNNLQINECEIVRLKKVVVKIDACLKKFKDLKVLEETSESDEFEEVDEKEYDFILPMISGAAARETPASDQPSTSSDDIAKTSADNSIKTISLETSSHDDDVNIWTPLRKDDDISDPTSYTLALSKLKKVKPEKKVKITMKSGINDSTDLRKIAPVIPYQHDLLEWDEEKKKEMRENITLGSAQELDIGPRFWSSSDRDGKGVCDAAMSSLTSRSFAFTGEFVPVKWSCRAPLGSGKLCPRMDRKKCPFHGKIIPRDETGKPSNQEDFERLKKLEEEKEKNKIPDWQDPKLLAELKEKTGLDLKMPEKGRRGKKKVKKHENLTDISKKMTSKTRLQNKVLSKGSMKRVSAVMDRMDAKKSYDKFGNNFNYALNK